MLFPCKLNFLGINFNNQHKSGKLHVLEYYLEQKLSGRSRVSAKAFSAELSSGKFEAGRGTDLDAATPVYIIKQINYLLTSFLILVKVRVSKFSRV